jgi:hypothetical protein
MSLRKLFLTLSLLLLIGLWGACVDIPSGPGTPTSFDFRALVRFVNASPGSAAGTVTVDGSPVGSAIGYQAATPYLDVAAGSRKMKLGGADLTVALGTEQQSTVVFYANGSKFVNLIEGHMNKNNADPLKAKIKFVNLAEGSATNLIFTANGGLDSAVVGTAGFEAAPQYTTIDPASNLAINCVSIGSFTADINGGNEVPPVNTYSTGTATVTMTDTGGIVYKIDVLSDNRQGFYTAAHFHRGAAGTNGPVIQAIDVSGQVISFPSTKVGSADTAVKSFGFGTFRLARTYFKYSIDWTVVGTDSFTSAHFRAGSATGPIIRTIRTTTFFTRLDSLSWVMSPTLVDSVRQGILWITAGTKSSPSAGVSARIVPDTATANSYTGQWKGVSLDTLRQVFNNSGMYINFHSTAHPGGQVRGQVTPAAKYAVTALPATNFLANRMYTIIATESGPDFKLLLLNDRQFGVSKPVGEGGSAPVVQTKK